MRKLLKWAGIVLVGFIALGIIGSAAEDPSAEIAAAEITTTTTTTEPPTTTTTTEPTTTTTRPPPPTTTTTAYVMPPELREETARVAYILTLREWSENQPFNFIDISSDEELYELGYLACATLDEGGTVAELVGTIISSFDDEVNIGAASYMLGAAVGALCPEYEQEINDLALFS